MSRSEKTIQILGGCAALTVALVVTTACASATKTALRQAATTSSSALSSGDCGKALDIYQKIYEKNRANGQVVSSYAALIKEVKAAGEAAEDQGRYLNAQTTYAVLAERWDGFSALERRLSFNKADLEARIKDCRLALCERQFRQEIEAGNHAKALAAYQTALKAYPLDAAVKKRYAKGVAELWSIAVRAQAAKDCSLAGRVAGLLRRVIEAFEVEGGKAGEGVPSREVLDDAIRQCSLELTNAGLAEYRKGNLESAIGFWDDLLAFEPGNAEIKKAVETARAQLGKLKSPGKPGSRNDRSTRGARSPG